MMIRPDNAELARQIEIALATAKTYSLRDMFSPTGKFNRSLAVDTLTQRVMATLRQYEITREATFAEQCDRTMPMFPEIEGGK